MMNQERLMNANLARDPKNRLIMSVPSEENESIGKQAITHYKVIERFNYLTLVRM